MSGIAGYLGGPQPPAVLRAMAGKQIHRGEDVLYHEEEPVNLAVRQSAREAQALGDRAFTDPDRGLAIVFAGDFLNYREEFDTLQKKGARFTSDSVAEVVLRLYEVYGVSCVNRMRGGFVFAIHDPQKDLVFIARDPMGAKPLYYATTQSGTFVFASEIKSLFEHPGIQTEADLRGIDAFLSMGCSPGPDAMFKGVHKLQPGHRILWNPGLHVMIEPYWQRESFAKADPVLKSDDDFRARFAALFEDAVRQQADGSVLFLTGDVESAAIASVLAKDSKDPVHALCFDVNTGPASAATAAKLGLKTEPLAFGTHDLDKLPEAIWAIDEPVADIRLAPFFVAARFASRNGGGLLTGAGASSMFASLPAQKQVLKARQKPQSWYKLLKSVYAAAPQASIGKSLGFEGRIGPRTKQRLFDFVDALRNGSLWRQYLSVAAVIDARDKQELYLKMLTPVTETFADLQKDPEGWPTLQGALMAIQAGGFTDGILAPLEKTGMFNSTQCRMPFADHRLAEFLIGLPDDLRCKGGRDKILLRDYLSKAHPGLLDPVPAAAPAAPRKSLLAECLAAEPLKGMVETCLSDASVRRRELFDVKKVRAIIAGSKTEEAIYAKQVFALLSLELWFRIFIDHEKGWMTSH